MKRFVAASLLAACGAGWAGLGDPAVPAAGATASSLRTPSGAAYTQVQRRLDSGTTLHEFVDAAGTVFAVAWEGPFLPDLRGLLGRHFQALTAQEAAGRGRGAVAVQRPDLVIVSAGRMGAFHGQAWLPRQLPAGFDPRTLP